jgi:predicted dehydrogenase
LGRKLRVGFVGGGLDSVIGQAHLISLRTDGMADIVAGAFSIDPEVGRATGRSLLLEEDRIYASWHDMLEREQQRDDRIDAVGSSRRPRCTVWCPRRSWTPGSTYCARSR